VIVQRVMREDKTARTDEKEKKVSLPAPMRSILNTKGSRKSELRSHEYDRRDHTVPAHDQRDFEFARSMVCHQVVIQNKESLAAETMNQAYRGRPDDSGKFDGLTNTAAKKIADHVEPASSATVNWRLRDWGISRQRYWDTRFPSFKTCGTVRYPKRPGRFPDMADRQGLPLTEL
jgi:valyl-tRNA synthetase